MVQDCTAYILNLSEHMAYTREKRNACRVLEGKPETKRPLGRHRHAHDDNIKMDLK
jgi:hypothetical protein